MGDYLKQRHMEDVYHSRHIKSYKFQKMDVNIEYNYNNITQNAIGRQKGIEICSLCLSHFSNKNSLRVHQRTAQYCRLSRIEPDIFPKESTESKPCKHVSEQGLYPPT